MGLKKICFIKHSVLFSLLGLLLVVPILMFGCNNTNSVKTVSCFPVQKQVETFGMAALMQGVLTCDDNGYLRVDDVLIIWIYGYSYQLEDGKIWILDENNTRIFKVGDWVKIVGGEIPKYWAEEKIGQSLPENCEGPYWLMWQYVQ